MRCALENIQAVWLLPQRSEVNRHGQSIGLLLNDVHERKLDHYICTVHDCWFKQWPAVLAHLGGGTHTATLIPPPHDHPSLNRKLCTTAGFGRRTG